MYQSQRDVIFAEDILCKALSTLRWVIAATLPMKEVRVCEAMKSPVGTLSDGTVLHQQDGGTKSRQVPIWEKSNLTLEEAAAYSGIGINKLREMSDSKDCTFVLWNGTKRLLKRRRLDEHLDRLFSI